MCEWSDKAERVREELKRNRERIERLKKELADEEGWVRQGETMLKMLETEIKIQRERAK